MANGLQTWKPFHALPELRWKPQCVARLRQRTRGHAGRGCFKISYRFVTRFEQLILIEQRQWSIAGEHYGALGHLSRCLEQYLGAADSHDARQCPSHEGNRPFLRANGEQEASCAHRMQFAIIKIFYCPARLNSVNLNRRNEPCTAGEKLLYDGISTCVIMAQNIRDGMISITLYPTPYLAARFAL